MDAYRDTHASSAGTGRARPLDHLKRAKVIQSFVYNVIKTIRQSSVFSTVHC